MYRTAVKRLLSGATSGNVTLPRLRSLTPLTAINGPRYSTTVNPPPPPPPPHHHQTAAHQNPNLHEIPRGNTESLGQSDSSSSSTAWSTSSAEDARRRQQRQSPRADYQEEQARVLQASLLHVPRLGWSEEAMIAGARDVGVSPAIVGAYPRKEAALVEFFMDDCLQRLIDRIDADQELQNLIPSERISKLVRIRLEMQAPYISKWPQALSIQAHPANVPTSFKQRAMLVDEIWHAAGDEGTDVDWYVKRTVLGGIYSTTEIYMLTDSSPDFRDTWQFLDERVKDAFDLKKTVQEVAFLKLMFCKVFGRSFWCWNGKFFARVREESVSTMSCDSVIFSLEFISYVSLLLPPKCGYETWRLINKTLSQGEIVAEKHQDQNFNMATTTAIVKKLNLQPHPEGGFYSETFRDKSIVLSTSHLPTSYKVDRPVSTSIYFLVPSGNVSLLHRIPCAETWHFYLGEPLTVLELNEADGKVKLTCLGSDLTEDNQQPQYTVPPNVWFGSFPTKDYIISPDGAVVKAAPKDPERHYSLVGCTCAPAFQFEDFELGKRSELLSHFPKYEAIISLLTLPD
ncbi:hypothetical protein Tsubulata_007679 [Turnera subulata]|uniref:Ubiquinone biosynthesis protein n=1 Tax=Turnera subulata TaxID=218843 RepID=A0A9Q0FNC9_9ROSI|nr:hypothetical protein Tsubulata_007679 [Turnera subulata]